MSDRSAGMGAATRVANAAKHVIDFEFTIGPFNLTPSDYSAELAIGRVWGFVGEKMDRSLVSTSRFLSLILRHRPEAIGVSLDSEGWLDVDLLIEAANRHGKKLTLSLVHRVVAENDKQRFAFSEDGLRIRANQGHSIRSVDLDLTASSPPEQLFHGTVSQFLDGIRSQGLQKRSRNHVHLSADHETAERVGRRRGQPIVLIVESGAMQRAGHEFFLAANGVWLTEEVPVEFIRFPRGRSEET